MREGLWASFRPCIGRRPVDGDGEPLPVRRSPLTDRPGIDVASQLAASFGLIAGESHDPVEAAPEFSRNC
jgi:hypothetical protein